MPVLSKLQSLPPNNPVRQASEDEEKNAIEAAIKGELDGETSEHFAA